MKYLVGIPAVFIAILAIGALGTARSRDVALYPPAQGKPAVRIEIVDHGVHAGLVVSLDDIGRYARLLDDPVLMELKWRFAGYSHLEIGWGDEQFYRFAPTLSHVTVVMAFNALSGLNDRSVLHVVGLKGDGATTFSRSEVLAFNLSDEGARRLMTGLAATFAPGADGGLDELGQGIYGPSLFYRAKGRYWLMQTCNHWISDLVHAAGLASSPLPAIWSGGLLAELEWRNHPVSAVQID